MLTSMNFVMDIYTVNVVKCWQADLYVVLFMEKLRYGSKAKPTKT